MPFKKRNTVQGNLPAQIMLEKVRREQAKRRADVANIDYQQWLLSAAPELNWTFPHMEYVASKLDAVVRGEIKRLMILMPYQHGKLLSHKELQLTSNRGWITHGELVPGDWVFSPSGKPVEVLAVSKEDYASWEVEFEGGAKIKAHENHEWMVFDRAYNKYRVVETKELARWQGKHRPRFLVERNAALEFPEQDLPINPYVLGAWLGDGRSSEGHIFYSPEDSEVTNFVDSFYLRKQTWTHSDTGVKTANYPQLKHELKKEGLLNNKHVPEIYKQASVYQRLQLLAGLIDTDGSGHQDTRYKKCGRYRFINCNKRLVNDVVELIRGLGWNPSITETQPALSSSGIQGRQVVYQVGFSPDRELPLQIPRKRLQCAPVNRRIGIKAIRPCKPELGRCIQVDSDDGLYLVGRELIPTHNSSVVTERFPAYMLERNSKKRIAVTAATADLAHNFSRKIRNLVKSRGIVELDNERQAVEQWLTVEGGGLKAVGAGGQIIGFPVDMLIIDDPVKNYDEANSPTVRESVWNWYSVDLYSRQQKDTPIVLIMCMTGDTPVLLADGSEKLLRNIRPNDLIASCVAGKLTTATVKHQKSNGLDYVFQIKTSSGKVVRANARHPFLVEEEGQLKWIKLRDLTIGQRIVTVKDSGANGKTKPVLSNNVTNLSVPEDIVPLTTAKRCGPMDIGLPLSIKSLEEKPGSNIGMELLESSMTQYLLSKTDGAPSVEGFLRQTYEHTGKAIFALTTTTPQTKSELYCATTAIWQLATLRQQISHSESLNICDFTTDEIIEITSDGIEEVFDIEVADTGNFIANGLVVHNTHWNEDDLAGRLQEQDKDETDPNYKWTVVKLPAVCEGTDPIDYPVKREIGEALCPELHPISQLENFRKVMGTMFAAGYQQRPTPLEGEIWKLAWFHKDRDITKPLRTAPKFPDNIKLSQVWDTALEVNQRNDPSAMVEGCMDSRGNIYVCARVNEKLEFPELIARMRTEQERVGNAEIIAEDKAATKPARQQLKTKGVPVIEIASGTNDKTVRAKSVSHYAEAGNVYLVYLPGNLNDELLTQLMLAPNGKHDDLHDCFVYLLMRVTGTSSGWDSETLEKLIKSLGAP